MSGADSGLASRGWRSVDADPAKAARYLALLQDILASHKQRLTDGLQLAPGSRVLEVGCGRGVDAEDLARRVAPAGRAVGTDASHALIAEAAARTAGLGLPLEFRVADAHALPFEDGSFDAVRVERTLQHIADPARAVREMARVTRPGGRIAAFEPDWDSVLIAGGDIAVARAVREHLCDMRHANGTIGRALPQLLHAAGYRDITVDAAKVPFQSLALADSVLFLSGSLDALVSGGQIEAAAARSWWDALQEMDGNGSFCASISGFAAHARV